MDLHTAYVGAFESEFSENMIYSEFTSSCSAHALKHEHLNWLNIEQKEKKPGWNKCRNRVKF